VFIEVMLFMLLHLFVHLLLSKLARLFCEKWSWCFVNVVVDRMHSESCCSIVLDLQLLLLKLPREQPVMYLRNEVVEW